MKYIKTASIFGTVGAIAVFLWFFIVYKLSINPFFSFWGNLVIVIVGIAVFGSLYFASKKMPVDNFSFGEGVLLGGLTTFILGIISCLLIYLSSIYFLQGAIEMYKADALQHLLKNKAQLIHDSSIEIYNTYLNSVPSISEYSSTQRYFISNILIPGLMFTFLSAIALRRKKEQE